MRKFRTAAALALCAVCLLQTAAPVLAAEDYPAPDVSGKTVEELIDAFRAEHDLTEDNFELSYYNTVTGESYDFNETKMLYGASTYKLPLNLYYYDMQLAGEITGDTMITKARRSTRRITSRSSTPTTSCPTPSGGASATGRNTSRPCGNISP